MIGPGGSRGGMYGPPMGRQGYGFDGQQVYDYGYADYQPQYGGDDGTISDERHVGAEDVSTTTVTTTTGELSSLGFICYEKTEVDFIHLHVLFGKRKLSSASW